MIKKYCLIILSLLICLFIYLFYRTEKTLINQVFISIVSFDEFMALRQRITCTMPLHEHIIYSFPEGLWVFSITLTSKSLFVKIGGRKIDMIYVPPIFFIGLELLQLLHFTNGRFDFWDIGFSILFWVMAVYLIKDKSPRQNFLHPFTIQSIICLLSYLIVYLAHV